MNKPVCKRCGLHQGYKMLCVRCGADLVAAHAEALAVVEEAERIKNEAHLAGDHKTYDLMRTVLAAKEE